MTTAPASRAFPEQGEPWLFISYSRTNSTLAEAITDALEGRGYRVWIDQESITPASDWRARISAGIEGARAVVLIISERFIASPNCDRELVEAVGLGKRLVPVLVEEIPIDRLPHPTPDLDLIMAVDGDIARVTDEIVEAVETDVDWLDDHTRLLQDALRWAENPDDRSLLLRGNDLRFMLGRVEAADRAPVVTSVQRGFLAASTQHRRRMRNLSWSAGGATAAIIALALIATVQRSAAIEARTAAQGQRIAADAEGRFDTQLDLGLRLALAARSWDESPATESTLLRGLTAGPGLRATAGIADGLDAASFAGRSIVAIDDDGALFQWTETAVTDLAATAAAVSTGSSGETVAMVPGGLMLGDVICPLDGRVVAVGTAPGGAVAAIGDGTSVVSVSAECEVTDLATSTAPVGLFASGPTGTVAWGTRRGEVRIVAGAETELGVVAMFDGAGVTALEFAEDGGLAVGLDNGTVAIVGGVTLPDAHRGAVTSITFADRGLVTAGVDGWIRVWDNAGRATVALTDVGPNGQATPILDVTQWAPGGLVSIDVTGRAQGWDLTGGSPLVDMVDPTTGVEDLYIDGEGLEIITDPTMAAVAVLDGVVVATSDSTEVRRGTSTWDVAARALAATDDRVYAATAEGSVVALDADGVAVAFDGHVGTVDAVAVSPDGRLVASGGDDRVVWLWRSSDGEVVGSFVGHTDRVLDIAFSPDGTRLASVGEDDRMIVWDIAAKGMIGSPIGHPGGARMEALVWESDTVLLAGGPGVFRWRLGEEDLVDAACRLAGFRTLTDEERSQYLGDVAPSDPCGRSSEE